MSSGKAFEIKVKEVFERAGFYTVHTRETELLFDGDSLQIDVISVWQNVCVLIEATTQEDKLSKKLDRFSERCRQLVDRDLLVRYMKELNSKLGAHIDVSKFQIRGLQFIRLFVISKLDEKEKIEQRGSLLDPKVYVWDEDSLAYFELLSKATTEFAKYEMLGFLGVTPDRVSGEPAGSKTVYAMKFFSPRNGPDIYTFSIGVKDMLKMAKVTRKDGWESDSFQRLVRVKKLDKIRDYLLQGGKFFANNIIVTLPQDVTFKETSKNEILGELTIPGQFGSITIIDGQHRLLAYTRINNAKHSRVKGSLLRDIQRGDQKIRKLMSEHKLIVTGIRYPEAVEAKERAGLFVEINNNQTPISKALIYKLSWDILESKHPEAFASRILDKLNSDGIFKDKIQLKEFQSKRIPETSIIRYALKYLVDANGGELYDLAPPWIQKAYKRGNYDPFIKHCVSLINQYFSEIVALFSPPGNPDPWNDTAKKGYMLASVVSIAAFLRLLRHFLYPIGVRDTSAFFETRAVKHGNTPRDQIFLKTNEVKACLACLSRISFDKKTFVYRGSEWGRFEADMLRTIREKQRYRQFGSASLVVTKWAKRAGLI